MSHTHSNDPDTQFSIEKEATTETKASPTLFQMIVAEFLGTYILMFVGCGSTLVDREKNNLTIIGIATVWGLLVMAIVYSLGHISGAHLNPAISIAFGASRRLSLTLIPVYVSSQLIGATLACLTLRVLFNDQPDIKPALTQYSDSVTDIQAVIFEFMITFILMLIVCGVATDDRADKGITGFVVGATIWFIALTFGPITGASMNPARSIAPAIVSGVYKNLWVYIIAPILGALAAVLVYSVLRLPQPHKSKDKTKTKTKTITNSLITDPQTNV